MVMIQGNELEKALLHLEVDFEEHFTGDLIQAVMPRDALRLATQRQSDLWHLKQAALAFTRRIRHALVCQQVKVDRALAQAAPEDAMTAAPAQTTEEEIETPDLGEALQPFATEVEVAIPVDADEPVAFPIAIEVAPIAIQITYRPRTGRGKCHAREICGNSRRMLPTVEAPAVNDRCENCYGIQPDAVQ